ncbi:Zinc finger BED domain containing protein 4 [Dissostichus eleginoides]|uniref:Zinc finger BED domain containing protein 4 n=1 Tax=Dissostichus eleginoides TaxID=100907 RepID=A0AAD9C0S7_DISEL|nr:Zinc finger BED domain containing protein 4 [Dissostichus eleginoides]
MYMMSPAALRKNPRRVMRKTLRLSKTEAIERTPCVVHTLQLVVDMIQKDLSVKPLLDRIRVLVRLFRKSSVAIQRLLKLCGLTLVKDCPTRWSSTYLMISRLLQVKDSLVEVADGMGWDCLLPVAEAHCSQRSAPPLC